MTGYMRGRATLYKGITMRSRLEASFAAWLDGQSVAWKYEPQCFADASGQYLPDFLIQDEGRDAYCEVKPPTADTAAALYKMHVIRASVPMAILNVVVPTGVYPNQRWAVVGKCRAEEGCSFCSPSAPAFHDARTIPGANRSIPTNPQGRATIGGRARRDSATSVTEGRATIGGRARRYVPAIHHATR